MFFTDYKIVIYNMDNKKNGSEQKTRLILLCVLLFIGEFAWFLLGRHNAEPISANDIIRAILFAVVALPVVILIFYHPLVKNFFNRDYRKNTTDDGNRATGSEKFIFGQTTYYSFYICLLSSSKKQYKCTFDNRYSTYDWYFCYRSDCCGIHVFVFTGKSSI